MPFQMSSLLKRIPDDLQVCSNAASDAEIAEFAAIRRRYAADPARAVAETDKIRAFRLATGAKRYIEIGTFDKFNLRYMMGLLDPRAVVVDLDIAENVPARTLLEQEKPPQQIYHCIIGDSTAPSTVDAVVAAAGEEPFDAVFIDANHVASFAMTDFALYGERVAKTGYVFFHDVKWEGSGDHKGVADALDVLQRFVPVYQVLGGQPVTHWYRPLVYNAQNWGGVGIIRGEDLHKSLV